MTSFITIMLLRKLIKKYPINIEKNIEIKNLASDSRKVKKGDLFFAIKGTKLDGNEFIKEALNKGAKAVICSSSLKLRNKNTIFIKDKNPRLALAYACSKFFKDKPKNIIAVTGTNGKTSVADFFYQILKLNKVPVASIGTLGVKKNKKTKKLKLTSPDTISLHRELNNLKKLKINNVIIEASSHGLHQGRLNLINFKAGIFTNFTQDHLDYHKSMKNYLKAKMILFSTLLKKNKFMITDKKLKEFSTLKQISSKKKLKLITIKNSSIKSRPTNLIGNFQIKNLSMAIIAANLCGLNKKKILSVIKKIKSINGRLQLTRILPNKAKVFIDYAHTPDALLTAIKSLEDHYKTNPTLVFGCGGERDIKKRPLMAKIAGSFCNKIYVTDDNPRNESPKKIRKQITKNLFKKNFFEIGNRKKAIQTAIQKSEPLEIILIAGKGHEELQDYGKKTLNISDKSIVKKTKIEKRKWKDVTINNFLNQKILNNILKTKQSPGFNGVSINSKELKKGNLFIAIKGKNKDGHNFISEAIKKGASVCVTSKNNRKIKRKKLIRFNNTNKFLRILAIKKRNYSRAKIIGVTGSSGKTTVKTLLGNLLSKYGNTYFSPKSFNNHYGVPLSLSNLESHHQFGVFEIGMSKAGEINRLSKMVKPDIGVITNVAAAHIENFKNIKEIAKAKGEIINNIKKKGTLILNRDDSFFEYFNNLAKRKGINTISFGLSSKSNIYPIYIKQIKNKKLIKIKIFNETLILKINDNNILNILSSLAVLRNLGLDLREIKSSFLSLESPEGRGKVHKIKRYKTNFRLIDESYNANPLSVSRAISNLSNIKKNSFRKYLLLGDMLELGNKSDFYHKKLSKIINNSDIDKLFVYGDKILKTYKYIYKNKQGNILQNKDDFDDIFSEVIKKNDYLMIKGSNATGLNQLSNHIIKGRYL